MSKFISIIENVMGRDKQLSPEDEATKDIERKKKNKEVLSPAEKEIDRMNNLVLKKAKTRLQKQLTTSSYNPLKEEEEDDTVDQTRNTQEPTQTQDVLSPEGEVFYVDLMKKALFVDLDNIELNATEKDVITNDVTPTNAKQVAEVLRKIINDFGLSA
jgi:hypothetical protein